MLRHSWNYIKNRIHKRNCLDTVLASVRTNVVAIAGMGMLCSIGFLLVMASAREFINGLRGTAYRHLEESRLASQKLVSRTPSLAAAAIASPLSAKSRGSGLHVKADEYVMETNREDAQFGQERSFGEERGVGEERSVEEKRRNAGEEEMIVGGGGCACAVGVWTPHNGEGNWRDHTGLRP